MLGIQRCSDHSGRLAKAVSFALTVQGCFRCLWLGRIQVFLESSVVAGLRDVLGSGTFLRCCFCSAPSKILFRDRILGHPRLHGGELRPSELEGKRSRPKVTCKDPGCTKQTLADNVIRDYWCWFHEKQHKAGQQLSIMPTTSGEDKTSKLVKPAHCPAPDCKKTKIYWRVQCQEYLCKAHFIQFKSGIPLRPIPVIREKPTLEKCQSPNCTSTTQLRWHHCHDLFLCQTHHEQHMAGKISTEFHPKVRQREAQDSAQPDKPKKPEKGEHPEKYQACGHTPVMSLGAEHAQQNYASKKLTPFSKNGRYPVIGGSPKRDVCNVLENTKIMTRWHSQLENTWIRQSLKPLQKTASGPERHQHLHVGCKSLAQHYTYKQPNRSLHSRRMDVVQ